MNQQELEQFIQNEVEKRANESVTARLRAFGASLSSVKMERSASGKDCVEIKVYDENPLRALNYARYLRREALQKLGLAVGDAEDGQPVLEPTDEELGCYPANVASPAAARRGEAASPAGDSQADDEIDNF